MYNIYLICTNISLYIHNIYCIYTTIFIIFYIYLDQGNSPVKGHFSINFPLKCPFLLTNPKEKKQDSQRKKTLNLRIWAIINPILKIDWVQKGERLPAFRDLNPSL